MEQLDPLFQFAAIAPFSAHARGRGTPKFRKVPKTLVLRAFNARLVAISHK
jgi:hypothetical protein